MPTSERALPILLPLALLTACGDRIPETPPRQQGQAAATQVSDDHILCAHGDAPLAPDCTVEMEQASRGTVLTLRHPDGSFHRLLVTKDGRGVIAADGAVRATVAVAGSHVIDVTLGGDRYRLPATVRHPA